MEYSIEIMMAFSFLVMGVSLLLRTSEWEKWINHLIIQGPNSSLALGSINTLLGSFILSFHWVWSGVFLIVTIFGMLFLLRGTILLLWPYCLMAIWGKMTSYFNPLIKMAGLAILLIALILFFNLYGYGGE